MQLGREGPSSRLLFYELLTRLETNWSSPLYLTNATLSMARTAATAETIRRLPLRCVHQVVGYDFQSMNPLFQYVAMDELTQL
jgi:hypothetical protein